VVLAHRLEDVEARIEGGKEDVLFLGVVEAVCIRPYEVEAAADEIAVRLRPRVEAVEDGGEDGEELIADNPPEDDNSPEVGR